MHRECRTTPGKIRAHARTGLAVRSTFCLPAPKSCSRYAIRNIKANRLCPLWHESTPRTINKLPARLAEGESTPDQCHTAAKSHFSSRPGRPSAPCHMKQPKKTPRSDCESERSCLCVICAAAAAGLCTCPKPPRPPCRPIHPGSDAGEWSCRYPRHRSPFRLPGRFRRSCRRHASRRWHHR